MAAASSPFTAVTAMGALIAPAQFAKIAAASLPGQDADSYGVPKGLTLRDELARFFRIGQTQWRAFSAVPTPGVGATARFIEGLLKDVLGFTDIARLSEPVAVGERSFPVALMAGAVPIAVAPAVDAIDRQSDALSAQGRRRSVATLMQEFLNAEATALWGLATNGRSLRLVRDNPSLTRPAFIEFDLAAIFDDEAYADFAALFLTLHRSRFAANDETCPLEDWRSDGAKAGAVARDKLRDGVEAALLLLGQGFLENPANTALAERLRSGALSLADYYATLLRLVYRLIFLLAAEDRGLLHPADAPVGARQLYARGYALGRLRDRSVRRAAWDRHHDAWEGLCIVMRALGRGEPRLGLPALGGLFDHNSLPDLEGAILANSQLLEAMYRLAWLREQGGPAPVNWRDMESEELGSVYEGLLELVPRLERGGTKFSFATEGMETKGNARKVSGSYYTPDSLVQALLDSALTPLLDGAILGAEDQSKALLALRVVDPACGSGHFLLAAARRIAARLAAVRTGGSPAPDDYRHALREVMSTCIHGVDRNPMAVELTKVALWIETVSPGLPLGFLDAQIRCGDSLLGVFDLKVLEAEIPDVAYKPLTGDDKEVAKYYAQKNRREGAEKVRLAEGFGFDRVRNIMLDFEALRAMPENTVKEIEAKAARLHALTAQGASVWQLETACDLYVSAFLLPKQKGGPHAGPDGMPRRGAETVPTSGTIWEWLRGVQPSAPLFRDAINAARAARAFHWPLEFPDVIQRGGFDAVLGNPPWEKYTILEREFFAHIPEIAAEPNAAKRQKAVETELKRSPPLAMAWNEAQRESSAKGEFVRGSGRFPLSAVGELNLYPLFAELGISASNNSGWVGFILKSLMFTGSTWKGFTDQLITSGKLRSVFDFKNWEMLFSSVGFHERYSLATMGPVQPESRLRLAVGLTNPAQLTDGRSIIDVDRTFPRRVNPETATLPQCETPDDLRILSRIAERFPTLGHSDWRPRYSRGLDMTGDAAELRDRESLEAEGFELQGSWFVKGPKLFAPVYEGKFIHQYDHRFATFDGIPSEKRFGIKAATINPTSIDKARRDFEIVPRYWVSKRFYESNTSTRKIRSDWNIAFRDTTNVISNFRTAVGCIVGPSAFNYKCPNVVIDKGDPVSSALFLSMFNSVPYDYLLRQKFYGANLTKSMLMQTFVVGREMLSPHESRLIDAVAALTNTSNSVNCFADNIGKENRCANDAMERVNIRAWIDALYFRLFGFEMNEVEYVFETFPIWKDKSTAIWGSFLEKERALACFSAIEAELN